MSEEGELTDSAETPPTNAESKFASPSCRMTPSGIGKANVLYRKKWLGCSHIIDFEILDKVGEGTFGYPLSLSLP